MKKTIFTLFLLFIIFFSLQVDAIDCYAPGTCSSPPYTLSCCPTPNSNGSTCCYGSVIGIETIGSSAGSCGYYSGDYSMETCSNYCGSGNIRYYFGYNVCGSSGWYCQYSAYDCDNYDGWYDSGSSYSCCSGFQQCTCQNQQYKDYYCSDGSCAYSITNTRTNQTNCSCVSGSCGADCSTGGSCSDYCGAGNVRYYSGTCDSGCDCSYSSSYDCDNLDGWVNSGSPYSCCDGAKTCTCQDQVYKDYSCSGSACSLVSQSQTQTIKTNCSCVSGSCGATCGSCSDYCGSGNIRYYNGSCSSSNCTCSYSSSYDCDNLDGCSGSDYYDYSCSVSVCSATISYNDSRCSSCQCTSGSCCDGCNYRSSSYVCNILNTEYGCPWGTTCGDDVGVRYQRQYCSGISSACNGSIAWTSWSVADNCASTETCAVGDSTCNTDPSCVEPSFDFSISVNPLSSSVNQGFSGTTTVTTTLVSGTTNTVNFSVSNLPASTTAYFSQASCSPTCSSVMTVSTDFTTPVGNYSINVCATDGTINRCVVYGLTVTASDSVIVPPQVITDNATEIDKTSVIINGNLVSLGYNPSTCTNCSVIVWFDYGTSSESYTASTTPQTRTYTGSFSATITDLVPGTDYYFRARARNGGSW